MSDGAGAPGVQLVLSLCLSTNWHGPLSSLGISVSLDGFKMPGSRTSSASGLVPSAQKSQNAIVTAFFGRPVSFPKDL